MGTPAQIESPAMVDRLLPSVRELMTIEKMQPGNQEAGYLARYEGRLLQDPEDVLIRLDPVFKHEGVTLYLREERGLDVVLAMPGVIDPEPSNPLINVGLFILTSLSMLLAGTLYGYEGPLTGSASEILLSLWGNISSGLLFATGLMSILFAHEFGHYIAARLNQTAVSLPYFLPFPGSLFGTLGAFIRLKEPPRNRKALLDIGLSGPIAGFVVAVPVLIVGLMLSEVGPLPASSEAGQGIVLEGNSILYLLAKYITKGELFPQPITYAGVHPILYWIRYFFIGSPVPLGGQDVLLHPLAWAGWAGLLITALNLIPAGQLDGGHTIYVLVGQSAARLWPFIVIGLLLLGSVWWGWFIWAILIFFLGRSFARPRDEITPLDRTRRAFAVIGMVIFVLVFIPIPLRLIGAG